MAVTPAAFRRLCVETLMGKAQQRVQAWPAAFRRLCVETTKTIQVITTCAPAAFRRLCVETIMFTTLPKRSKPAAFRRLCVETKGETEAGEIPVASRLQAAVC